MMRQRVHTAQAPFTRDRHTSDDVTSVGVTPTHGWSAAQTRRRHSRPLVTTTTRQSNPVVKDATRVTSKGVGQAQRGSSCATQEFTLRRWDWLVADAKLSSPNDASPRNQSPSYPGRRFHAAAVGGGIIYLFGGEERRVPTPDLVANNQTGAATRKKVLLNDLISFDPQTETWRTLIAGSSKRGGADEGGSIDAGLSGSCEGGQLPKPRKGHSLNCWRDQLILFGGAGNQNYMNDLWLMSVPSADKDDTSRGSVSPRSQKQLLVWRPIELGANEPCPPPRAYHTSVVYKDHLYVYGGYGVPGSTNSPYSSAAGSRGVSSPAGSEGAPPIEVWSLDLVNMSWKCIATKNGEIHPCWRYGHSACATSAGYMYVFGGQVYKCLSGHEVCKLNLATMEWSVVLPGEANAPVSAPSAPAFASRKRGSANPPGSHPSSTPTASQGPSPRTYHSGVFLEEYGRWLIHGGSNEDEVFGDFFEFALQKEIWTPLSLSASKAIKVTAGSNGGDSPGWAIACSLVLQEGHSIVTVNHGPLTSLYSIGGAQALPSTKADAVADSFFGIPNAAPGVQPRTSSVVSTLTVLRIDLVRPTFTCTASPGFYHAFRLTDYVVPATSRSLLMRFALRRASLDDSSTAGSTADRDALSRAVQAQIIAQNNDLKKQVSELTQRLSRPTAAAVSTRQVEMTRSPTDPPETSRVREASSIETSLDSSRPLPPWMRQPVTEISDTMRTITSMYGGKGSESAPPSPSIQKVLSRMLRDCSTLRALLGANSLPAAESSRSAKIAGPQTPDKVQQMVITSRSIPTPESNVGRHPPTTQDPGTDETPPIRKLPSAHIQKESDGKTDPSVVGVDRGMQVGKGKIVFFRKRTKTMSNTPTANAQQNKTQETIMAGGALQRLGSTGRAF